MYRIFVEITSEQVDNQHINRTLTVVLDDFKIEESRKYIENQNQKEKQNFEMPLRQGFGNTVQLGRKQPQNEVGGKVPVFSRNRGKE